MDKEPSLVVSGLRFLGVPFLDGNMFKQGIIYCNRYIVVNFVNFLFDMELHPRLTYSLIARVDISVSHIC